MEQVELPGPRIALTNAGALLQPPSERGLQEMRSSTLTEMPREEAFMAILASLHARWRLAVCIPLLYLLIAAWILQSSFAPSTGRLGFFPVPEQAFAIFCFLGALLSGGAFLWQGQLLSHQYEQLREHSQNPEAFLSEARRHQLFQFTLADLATAPGVLLFLMQGSFAVLAGFVLLGEIIYLRAFPSELELGRAMFRSGPAGEG